MPREIQPFLSPQNRPVQSVQAPNGGASQQYVQLADGSWLAVPWGTDPQQYAAMTPEQRLVADMLADARETRDTNRDAVLAGFADVQAGQQAASDFVGAMDWQRLGQMNDLTAFANARDDATLQGINEATQGANAYDAQTLDLLNNLFQGATFEDRQAVQDFSGAADAANQFDLGNLSQYAGAADAANQFDINNLGDFGAAADAANAAEQDALSGLLDAYGEIDEIDPSGYGADLTSQAALSAADPRAIEAQYAALGEFGDRSGDGMTAASRLMMEQARRTEEQDRRNAMQAQLRDLNARGMGGSGAEIGAMLGAQSMTSQNRMLQDLAALAQAEARSDRMLGAQADLASQLRGQSFGEQFQTGSVADQMAQFNRSQSLDHTRWQDEFRRMQEQQAWQNAQQLQGAQTDAAGREYGRAGDQYGAGRDAIAGAYGRAGDQYGASRDAIAGAYGRAGDVYGAQRDYTDTAYTRGEGLADRRTDANQGVYDRNMAYQGAQLGSTRERYGRGMDYLDAVNQATQGYYGRERDRQGNVVSFTGLFTNQGASDGRGVREAQQTQLGQIEADQAQEALEDDFDLFDPSSWI